VVSTLFDQIKLCRAILRNRSDTEHEMTLNRIVLSWVFIVYFCAVNLLNFDPEHRLMPVLSMFGLYNFLAILLFAHIIWKPATHHLRRLHAIILDIVFFSYLVHMGDEAGAILYPMYFWPILGNGFRFGVSYLYAATLMSCFCFIIVGLTTPFWLSHSLLAGGLLVGLAIVPAYAGILVRKMDEAKKQAEAANRTKSLFLASVSHELRTPLNAIIGLSDVLLCDQRPQDESEMIRTIGRSSRALLNLINTILDISRHEAGHMTPRQELIDIEEVMFDLRALLLGEAKKKKIQFLLAIDPAIPRHLLGSRRHIDETLINLIGNAIKFTSTGMVSLSVRCEHSEAHQMVLRFDVIDTGIGIAPEAQGRIFDQFTQADDTIIDRFGGTGLGLSIARKLVESHGGNLHVESMLHVGSHFHFTMTFTTAPAPKSIDRTHMRLGVISDDKALISLIRGHDDISLIELTQSADDERHRECDAVIIDQAYLGRDYDELMAALYERLEPHHICLISIGSHMSLHKIMPHLCMITRPLNEPMVQRCCDMVRHYRARLSQNATPLGAVKPQYALRILVAEDNRTNQLVVQRILEIGGHHVDMADNGRIALDMLSEGNYDLVLMDINMPVLNGIEATRLYRYVHFSTHPVPIIGLTADASVDMQQRCEAAGMNGCLSKPIEAQHLLDFLSHISPRVHDDAEDKEKAVDALPEHSLTPHTEDAANTTLLAPYAPDANARTNETITSAIDQRKLEDLRRLGGDEFVTQIVQQFISDGTDVLRRLAECVSAGDIEIFRDEAHALRSCAANVGAQGIYDMCLGWRNMSAHELAAHGADHMRQLESAFETACHALDDYKH
jgi:two-component system, sensor histidine kinase RpfC